MVNANQAMPVIAINGRRTLVIGMGSTGAMICNQILERLTWMYGSAENVPWLQMLVFETAPVPASSLIASTNIVRQTTIGQQEYAGLIRNPGTYQERMEFPRWNIDSVSRKATQVIDGAGNWRHVGRIALMFPRNMAALNSVLTEALDELRSETLTDQTAGVAFNRASNARYHVTLHQNDGTRAIDIYVVGSLCGGTSSGAFIDLGYLLNKRIEVMNNVNVATTGMFLIPSSDSDQTKQKGNAYAALLELNHFSDDRSEYEAIFDGLRVAPGVPQLPYNYQYILQTQSNAKTDYAKLITATSDYIYNSLIGPFAGHRDGDRSQTRELLLTRDLCGAPQPFYTFHISTIEFPFARVAKGCAVRLMKRAIDELTLPIECTVDLYRGMKRTIPLADPQKLLNFLLNDHPDSDAGADVTQGIGRLLSKIRDKAIEDHTPLELAQQQLEAGLVVTDFQATSIDFPVGIIPQTITKKRGVASAQLLASLSTAIDIFFGILPPMPEQGLKPLTFAQRGIGFLNAFLTELNADLQRVIAARPAGLQGLEEEMRQSLDRIAECRKDPFLSLTLQKRAAVTRYVDEYLGHATAYYQELARLKAREEISRLYIDFQRSVTRLIDRLTNTTCGLQKRLDILKSNLVQYGASIDAEANTRATDGYTRAINGQELFTAGETIDNEYDGCLDHLIADRNLNTTREELERDLALQSASLYYQRDVRTELLRRINEVGQYDSSNRVKVSEEIDPMELDVIVADARETFRQPMQRKSVVDRLMEDPDRLQKVKSVITGEDAYFLEWYPGGRHDGSDARKKYAAVYFNHGTSGADFNSLLGQCQGVPVQRRTLEDRNQIIFHREMASFSLGTIAPLDDQTGHWATADYKGLEHHARGDIEEWLGWRQEDERLWTNLRTGYLYGIALGILQEGSRAAEYVLRDIPPRGGTSAADVFFSNDIDESALRIKKEGLNNYLDTLITRWWQIDWDTTAFIKRYRAFFQKYHGMFVRKHQQVSDSELEMLMLPYIFRNPALEKSVPMPRAPVLPIELTPIPSVPAFRTVPPL